MDKELFLKGFIDCGMWAEYEEDQDVSINDITPESMETIKEVISDFVDSNLTLLSGLDPEQCGHDFYLTCNGHGAGFWDRGLKEIGDKLTESCRPYGTIQFYTGDDNQIYTDY